MNLRVHLVLLSACAAIMPAQVMERPLTNSDVIDMVRAGVPESTVIMAIDRAVARGNTKFDQSPNGVIQLKNAGASEEILNNMLNAPNIPPYEPSTSVNGLPVARGLYYQAGTAWNSLGAVLVWPQVDLKFRTNWANPFGQDHAHENWRYVLDGRQADLRVSGPRPAFYLRSQKPETGWWVLRLNSGANHREATVKVPDSLARHPTMAFDSGSPVKLEPRMAAGDVLTLRPTTDLAPGEYLMFKWVPGQTLVIEGYPFEIGG